MKRSLAPLLIIALLVSTVCTAVFYALVAGKFASPVQANNQTPVVVATRELARGTTLFAGDLKVIKADADSVPGAFGSVDQAVGLTTFRDVEPGEAITRDSAGSKKKGAGLGVPAGMRAVSILVADSAGIVPVLKPGQRVDVQAVVGDQQNGELKTVLQNVEVLQVNSKPEPLPGRQQWPIVTLLTTPQEADILGLADSLTRVRIALRNPLDGDRKDRTSLTVAQMMRGVAARELAPGPSRPKPTAVAAMPSAAPQAGALSLPTSGQAASCTTPAAQK